MVAPKTEEALATHVAQSLADDGAVVTALSNAFPQLLAVYAFGSRVHGSAHADSDLDLAVLIPGYAEPLQLWEAASQLSDVLRCPVDLLDLRRASTVMQSQVITQGKLLWSTQPETGLFESFVISEKIELDEARSGLLKDITTRGKVYGR